MKDGGNIWSYKRQQLPSSFSFLFSILQQEKAYTSVHPISISSFTENFSLPIYKNMIIFGQFLSPLKLLTNLMNLFVMQPLVPVLRSIPHHLITFSIVFSSIRLLINLLNLSVAAVIRGVESHLVETLIVVHIQTCVFIIYTIMNILYSYHITIIFDYTVDYGLVQILIVV